MALILLSTNALAGGRHIYCDGQLVNMDVSAKGPTPSDELHMSMGYVLSVREIMKTETSSPYAFTRVYQATDGVIQLTAILHYADGKHTFSVFNSGELIEEVPCTLGF